MPSGQDATQVAPLAYLLPEQAEHVLESEHEVQDESKVVHAKGEVE